MYSVGVKAFSLRAKVRLVIDECNLYVLPHYSEFGQGVWCLDSGICAQVYLLYHHFLFEKSFFCAAPVIDKIVLHNFCGVSSFSFFPS